jgi:hypothetical protein
MAYTGGMSDTGVTVHTGGTTHTGGTAYKGGMSDVGARVHWHTRGILRTGGTANTRGKLHPGNTLPPNCPRTPTRVSEKIIDAPSPVPSPFYTDNPELNAIIDKVQKAHSERPASTGAPKSAKPSKVYVEIGMYSPIHPSL